MSGIPSTSVWKLRPGADRRIRSGHPWVFSNELAASPKGHAPGAPVELQDARGQFVAWGYGNPHSLIAFRALSFFRQDENPLAYDFLQEKILAAWRLRRDMGFRGSFRLCFGESDYLPGLVLDYYLVGQEGRQGQVFAAQIVTAGLDVALHDLAGFFEGLTEKARREGLSHLAWDQSAVVLRNDVSVRKLEGLKVEPPRVVKDLPGWNLREAGIQLNASVDEGLITLFCDLVEGQKTGFFLDQTHNIALVARMLRDWAAVRKPARMRILDLCCYVGHWSAQLSRVLKNLGVETEVHLVDVSKTALTFAEKNARSQGAQVQVHEMDVLEGLVNLPSQNFDVVIADPPAFIKAKKDIPVGKHAYLKMNTQAFRLVRPGGLVVSCSCSGLLVEEEFRDVLRKASLRNFSQVRGVLRGGHAADHPTLMQFPEGFYLKMYTHQV